MTSGEPLASNPAGGSVVGSLEGPVPVVRLFGVSRSGASVMASVHGFTPYFFASVPSSFALNDASLAALRVVYDQKVRTDIYRIDVRTITDTAWPVGEGEVPRR